MQQPEALHNEGRRNFIAGMGASLMGLCLPTDLVAAEFWHKPREIWAVRPTTGEEIREVYWADGKLQHTGYLKLCQLFRDVKENKAVHMDPLLFDVLRGVRGYFENVKYDRPLLINSGYRTHATNKALSKEGAAKNSMHLHGKAVDFRMEKVPPEWLARLGYYFRQGGVGLYEDKNFVHLDTGNLRVWRK